MIKSIELKEALDWAASHVYLTTIEGDDRMTAVFEDGSEISWISQYDAPYSEDTPGSGIEIPSIILTTPVNKKVILDPEWLSYSNDKVIRQFTRWVRAQGWDSTEIHQVFEKAKITKPAIPATYEFDVSVIAEYVEDCDAGKELDKYPLPEEQ